jgi:uncharacterized protein (DUF2147 family)
MGLNRVIWVIIGFLAWGIAVGMAGANPVWNQDDVTGLWWSPEKDSKIEIYPQGEGYYGKIVWIIPKSSGKLDAKNPDPQKRNQTLLGSDIFFDLKFDGKDTWKDGRLYDPKSGNFYQGYLKLKDKDDMEVSGFILTPLFGRSEKFKRVDLHDAETCEKSKF